MPMPRERCRHKRIAAARHTLKRRQLVLPLAALRATRRCDISGAMRSR